MKPLEKINNQIDSDSINLIEIFYSLWIGKWYIISSLFISCFLGIVYLQNTTYLYEVKLKVMPVTPVSSNSSSISSLSGLASIVGVRVPQQNTANSFDLYKVYIRSRLLGSILVKDENFMSLYLGKQWKNKIKTNSTPINKTWRTSVKSLLGLPSHRQVVSTNDIGYLLVKNINVSYNPTSKITTISIMNENPNLAKDFLLKVHSITDNLLKLRSVSRTDDYIEFLNKKLLITTKQDQRMALISTLAEQNRLKMIASSNLAYAAEPFGDVFQSPAPVIPRIRNVLMACFIIGFCAGSFIIIAKHLFIEFFRNKFKKIT